MVKGCGKYEATVSTVGEAEGHQNSFFINAICMRDCAKGFGFFVDKTANIRAFLKVDSVRAKWPSEPGPHITLVGKARVHGFDADRFIIVLYPGKGFFGEEGPAVGFWLVKDGEPVYHAYGILTCGKILVKPLK